VGFGGVGCFVFGGWFGVGGLCRLDSSLTLEL
jgi:hypothetical protein